MNFRDIAVRTETIATVREAQARVMVMWTRAAEWGAGGLEAFEVLSRGRSLELNKAFHVCVCECVCVCVCLCVGEKIHTPWVVKGEEHVEK